MKKLMLITLCMLLVTPLCAEVAPLCAEEQEKKNNLETELKDAAPAFVGMALGCLLGITIWQIMSRRVVTQDKKWIFSKTKSSTTPQNNASKTQTTTPRAPQQTAAADYNNGSSNYSSTTSVHQQVYTRIVSNPVVEIGGTYENHVVDPVINNSSTNTNRVDRTVRVSVIRNGQTVFEQTSEGQ